MDFFYYLLIYPLESLMHLVLEGAYAFTGYWGASLVLLSLAVNIALIPLYHLAESWQEAERSINQRMAAKLKDIKAVYTGRERYMITKALYRQYGYSPIYALRTSCGLLIQIPFFFAAYHLLYSAPQLAGHGFWFISNLAQPDAFLQIGTYSINTLPFIMTGVNLLSAFVYTERLTRRDSIQLYGLAVLFLVLLYNSSAALLVYWTCNNIFSLVKNIFYTRFVYAKCLEEKVPQPKRAYWSAAQEWIIEQIPAKKAQGVTALLVCLNIISLVGSLILRKHMAGSLVAPLLACCGCLSILCAALLQAHAKQSAAKTFDNLSLFCIAGVSLFFISWGLVPSNKIYSPVLWWTGLWVCLGGSLGIAFFLLVGNIHTALTRAAAWCGQNVSCSVIRLLYGMSVFLLLSLVFIYTPARIWASDPAFFTEPLAALAAGSVWRAIITGLVFMLFFRMAGSWKGLLAVMLACFALSGVLYNFVATADYGLMDDVILRDPSLLYSWWPALVDPLVIASSFLVVWLCCKNQWASSLGNLLQGLAVMLVCMSGYLLITAPPAVGVVRHTESDIPPYAHDFFGFSATESNVVVVMLDMFTGAHLQRLLDENPALLDDLDGFTWYPDTVSAGDLTSLSIPSLLGGHAYTPYAINARKPDSIEQEVHKGFAVLPEMLMAQGYSLAFSHVDTLNPNLMQKISPAWKHVTYAPTLSSDVLNYWRKSQGLPSLVASTRIPFLTSVGVFHAAPWGLRGLIYQEGNWMGSQKASGNPVEGELAALQVLPMLSHTKSTTKTFKYIASTLTHSPWRIDGETSLPTDRVSETRMADGTIKEQVDAERCAINALVNWFMWMKREGVYDNTHIIIVSDHDGGESSMMGSVFAQDRRNKMLWRPHALLLVKNPQARGKLAISSHLMSSADVVGLICTQEALCPPEVADPLLVSPRLRTHSGSPVQHRERRHAKNQYTITSYGVNGTMFLRDNWKQLPNQQ